MARSGDGESVVGSTDLFGNTAIEIRACNFAWYFHQPLRHRLKGCCDRSRLSLDVDICNPRPHDIQPSSGLVVEPFYQRLDLP